jgi:hypothetical protein
MPIEGNHYFDKQIRVHVTAVVHFPLMNFIVA